jgi:hypothetical protein
VNPYLRAAARNEALRLQALEKLQARQAEAEAAPAELLDSPPAAPEPEESIEAVDVQVIERARDPQTGQFLPDDPTTPDVNEAWVVMEEA